MTRSGREQSERTSADLSVEWDDVFARVAEYLEDFGGVDARGENSDRDTIQLLQLCEAELVAAGVPHAPADVEFLALRRIDATVWPEA